MILNTVNILDELYELGRDYNYYNENRQKGHTRFQMAMESGSEYLRELSISDLDKPFRFLILASLECTDCAVAIPAFYSLFSQMSAWDYSIVYKNEISEFEKYFKVGSKQSIPQVIVLNEQKEYITRWMDKSEITKRNLKRIKGLGLPPDMKRDKIKNTPELHPRFEVKSIMDELITLLRKAVYYL